MVRGWILVCGPVIVNIDKGRKGSTWSNITEPVQWKKKKKIDAARVKDIVQVKPGKTNHVWRVQLQSSEIKNGVDKTYYSMSEEKMGWFISKMYNHWRPRNNQDCMHRLKLRSQVGIGPHKNTHKQGNIKTIHILKFKLMHALFMDVQGHKKNSKGGTCVILKQTEKHCFYVKSSSWVAIRGQFVGPWRVTVRTIKNNYRKWGGFPEFQNIFKDILKEKKKKFISARSKVGEESSHHIPKKTWRHRWRTQFCLIPHCIHNGNMESGGSCYARISA